MNYLTQEQFRDLTNNHKSWQQKSFENLRKSVADNENFYTQYKMATGGQKLLWLSFMHSDGIGSSRLLLSNEMTKAFPNGYYLAFPDRSCGLTISKDINENELQEIKDLVKGVYKNATTAMSGQLHLPRDFVIPEEWIQPIDKAFSNILTSEIFKLKRVN